MVVGAKFAVFVAKAVVGGRTFLHCAFLSLSVFSTPDYHCALLHDLSLKKVKRRTCERPPIFKVTGAFHA